MKRQIFCIGDVVRGFLIHNTRWLIQSQDCFSQASVRADTLACADFFKSHYIDQ